MYIIAYEGERERGREGEGERERERERELKGEGEREGGCRLMGEEKGMRIKGRWMIG